MEWLAENATNGYFLFAFAAFMLAGVWWIQKQVVYLAAAGAALIALLVFWLVIRNVPTAATTIEADLNSLAHALLAKDKDAAARYVIDDFKYKAKGVDKWYAALEELISDHSIDAIHIGHFELKSRTGADASVAFHLEAKHQGKVVYSADCPWKLARHEDTWRVTKVQLRNAGKDSDD